MRDYQRPSRQYQALFIFGLIAFTLPSFFSAGKLVESSYQRLAINHMIQEELSQVTILNRQYDETSKTLSLVVYGQELSNQRLETIQDNLPDYGLAKLKLKIKQINTNNQDIDQVLKLLNEKTQIAVEDQVEKDNKDTKQP